MIKEIYDLIKSLNALGVIYQWFQKNSPYYSLLSNLNHSFVLFLSEEFDSVALFIKRANEELLRVRSVGDCPEDFAFECNQYLILVSRYLVENNLLSGLGYSMLPEDIIRSVKTC